MRGSDLEVLACSCATGMETGLRGKSGQAEECVISYPALIWVGSDRGGLVDGGDVPIDVVGKSVASPSKITVADDIG